LATGSAGAQQEPPSPPKTLPPLPPPTAAQLERGRELLDKIAYVAAKVPLTDAAAVLAVFGFTDLFTKEYPTYTGVQPKGKGGGGSQPQDLVGTGLAAIDVRPRIQRPTRRTEAVFAGRLSLEETCISIDMVRETFTPMASKVESLHIFDIHPVLRPKPLHSTGHLVFFPKQHPFSEKSLISFRFEYQTCAETFTLSQTRSSEETIQ